MRTAQCEACMVGWRGQLGGDRAINWPAAFVCGTVAVALRRHVGTDN
jgi:hypothetical protein